PARARLAPGRRGRPPRAPEDPRARWGLPSRWVGGERRREPYRELIAERGGRKRFIDGRVVAARADRAPDDAPGMRGRPEVQIVEIEPVRSQREPACPFRPRGRLGSGAHTRAVVEDAARNGVPRRFGRRGDPDEVVDEWRYAPTVERIRSAIAGTLGTIASSSVGLYETSRSSGMLSADGCPIGTPRIVSSEM